MRGPSPSCTPPALRSFRSTAPGCSLRMGWGEGLKPLPVDDGKVCGPGGEPSMAKGGGSRLLLVPPASGARALVGPFTLPRSPWEEGLSHPDSGRLNDLPVAQPLSGSARGPVKAEASGSVFGDLEREGAVSGHGRCTPSPFIALKSPFSASDELGSVCEGSTGMCAPPGSCPPAEPWVSGCALHPPGPRSEGPPGSPGRVRPTWGPEPCF